MHPLIVLANLERGLRRSADALRDAVGGLLGTALEPSERAEVGAMLYDSRLDHVRTAIPEWEREWLSRDLPPSPARILIGGCGDGREARYLKELGYESVGFDPGPLAVRRFAQLGSAHLASYEDLAQTMLDEPTGESNHAAKRLALGDLIQQRFDAVLCGWCSLIHVVDPAERTRTIRALHRLCPAGPILLTVYPDGFAMPRGRAYRAGRAWGARIAKLRRRQPAAARENEAFDLRAGFLRGWSEDEIHAAAAATGRRSLLRGYDEGCWRYTLTPLLA